MPLSSSVRASLEEATALYEEFLVHEGRTYVEARGITLDLAATFRLGVVAMPPVGHEPFEGRLSIPYITKAGVVNIKFRCMESHECKDFEHPKYLNLGGGRTNIYNTLAFHRDSPHIAICEGELDTLILDGAVGIPAVGIAGVQNWKPFYERCFVDYERVFVFADGDDAGRDFARSIQSMMDGATVVRLPHGTDVSDIYLSEGAQGLRNRAGL